MTGNEEARVEPVDTSWVLHCRPGMERDLCAELAGRAGGTWSGETGWVQGTPAGQIPQAGLVFERQRLPAAHSTARSATRPIRQETALSWLGELATTTRPWTTHAYPAVPHGDAALGRHVHGLERAFRRVCRDACPSTYGRWRSAQDALDDPHVHVLQLMLTQREVWTSVAPSSALSDRVPGGVHRMRMDPAAPSRSYLKMEEALLRSGLPVTDGERVLDLGAAPGGWSHAFLKRGCHVIGVDRGPMKLRVPDVTSARFTHVREDGLVYVPPAEWLPLDWLVSDMLVPPGKALGLLRRWIGRRWARRFVVTLKLPQKQAWPVLRDVMAWLDRCEGFQYEIRQLYHNRREVTLWGTLGS